MSDSDQESTFSAVCHTGSSSTRRRDRRRDKNRVGITTYQRRRYWNSFEEMKLVEFWRRHISEITTTMKHTPVFATISCEMRDWGFNVNSQECRRKINSMKNKYNVEQSKLKVSGAGVKSNWPLYSLIDCLLSTSSKKTDVFLEQKTVKLFMSKLPVIPHATLLPANNAAHRLAANISIIYTPVPKRSVAASGAAPVTIVAPAIRVAATPEPQPQQLQRQQPQQLPRQMPQQLPRQLPQQQARPTPAQSTQQWPQKLPGQSLLKPPTQSLLKQPAQSIQKPPGPSLQQLPGPSPQKLPVQSPQQPPPETPVVAPRRRGRPFGALGQAQRLANGMELRLRHRFKFPGIEVLQQENLHLAERRDFELKRLCAEEREVQMFEQLMQQMQCGGK